MRTAASEGAIAMGLKRSMARAAQRAAEEFPKRIFKAISRARHSAKNTEKPRLSVRYQTNVYRKLMKDDIEKAKKFLEAAEYEILKEED
jgi:hypothetical protein